MTTRRRYSRGLSAVDADGKGRGGGFVAAQFALMGAILLAVLVPPDWPAAGREARWLGASLLAVTGVAISVAAGRALGGALTPCPAPVAGAPLAETGPYGVVRHPLYSGVLLVFAGWSLVAGPVALALTLALAVLWGFKARLEERHLRDMHPGWDAYAQRVRRRFVPGLY